MKTETEKEHFCFKCCKYIKQSLMFKVGKGACCLVCEERRKPHKENKRKAGAERRIKKDYKEGKNGKYFANFGK